MRERLQWRMRRPIFALWGVLIGLGLTGCATSKRVLMYSEDEYLQACEVTRAGNRPSQEHVNYLLYTPETADQEGVFLVAAYNPLGITQIDCATFVLNEQGEQNYSALPSMSQIKEDKDGKMLIQIFAYTLNASVGSDYVTAKLRLRRDNGEILAYDTEETFSLTPTEATCQQDGCGHVYAKSVTAQIHEADRMLFTKGKRVNLILEPLLGGQIEYTFDLPND